MKQEQLKNLTGKILRALLIGGGLVIASTSPYFASKMVDSICEWLFGEWSGDNTGKNKKVRDTFYYLRNRGLIEMQNKNGQIYISLTEEGRKRAGKYQINDLKIKKAKKWDKKWRILIFDISSKQKIKREALRGKLKELGFYQLQKSVWVYPYDFDREITLLRDFFGLNTREMTIIKEAYIEEDGEVKNFFKLR